MPFFPDLKPKSQKASGCTPRCLKPGTCCTQTRAEHPWVRPERGAGKAPTMAQVENQIWGPPTQCWGSPQGSAPSWVHPPLTARPQIRLPWDAAAGTRPPGIPFTATSRQSPAGLPGRPNPPPKPKTTFSAFFSPPGGWRPSDPFLEPFKARRPPQIARPLLNQSGEHGAGEAPREPRNRGEPQSRED